MQSDLELRRRVLVKFYRRYVAADRDWLVGAQAAAMWLRDAPPGKLALIGDPGSPVRRLYERREDARQRLLAAREKLETARRRQNQRRPGRAVLMIGVFQDGA
jgi:hypothetical protein